MAVSVMHEGDVSVFTKGRGLRQGRQKSRWLQLVIRQDTGLACINICKKNNPSRVKEAVALYSDKTRLSTSYARRDRSGTLSPQPGGSSPAPSTRDYQFTLTTLGSDSERAYLFRIPSLFQLEQWMAKLKQCVYQDRNWFSCQKRQEDDSMDVEVLLDLNLTTNRMSIQDPLMTTGEVAPQLYDIAALTEFGAERDHITLYFILCRKCQTGAEEVFVRSSAHNVNKIIAQVEQAVERALGDNRVERLPSSKCGYMVHHVCPTTPPLPRRQDWMDVPPPTAAPPPLPNAAPPLPTKRERPRLPFGPPELRQGGERIRRTTISRRAPEPVPGPRPAPVPEPQLPHFSEAKVGGHNPTKPGVRHISHSYTGGDTSTHMHSPLNSHPTPHVPDTPRPRPPSAHPSPIMPHNGQSYDPSKRQFSPSLEFRLPTMPSQQQRKQQPTPPSRPRTSTAQVPSSPRGVGGMGNHGNHPNFRSPPLTRQQEHENRPFVDLSDLPPPPPADSSIITMDTTRNMRTLPSNSSTTSNTSAQSPRLPGRIRMATPDTLPRNW